jgi:excinuclease ABC subunit A
VNDGNTVVVIEHHLDIIKVADWIIDLGPEGGDGGGTLVAQGTPEEIAKAKDSYTGKYLREALERQAGFKGNGASAKGKKLKGKSSGK